MSLVFQNIDPPLRPVSVYPRLCCGGRTHSPGGTGDGESIVWKTRDIGLASYSNNLSTHTIITVHKKIYTLLTGIVYVHPSLP